MLSETTWVTYSIILKPTSFFCSQQYIWGFVCAFLYLQPRSFDVTLAYQSGRHWFSGPNGARTNLKTQNVTSVSVAYQLWTPPISQMSHLGCSLSWVGIIMRSPIGFNNLINIIDNTFISIRREPKRDETAPGRNISVVATWDTLQVSWIIPLG